MPLQSNPDAKISPGQPSNRQNHRLGQIHRAIKPAVIAPGRAGTAGRLIPSPAPKRPKRGQPAQGVTLNSNIRDFHRLSGNPINLARQKHSAVTTPAKMRNHPCKLIVFWKLPHVVTWLK